MAQDHKKTQTKYTCEKCNYATLNKYDFARHNKTKKHLRDKLVKVDNLKSYKCSCGKTYKFASGLSRHKDKYDHDSVLQSADQDANQDANQDAVPDGEQNTTPKMTIKELQEMSQKTLLKIQENAKFRAKLGEFKTLAPFTTHDASDNVKSQNNNDFGAKLNALLTNNTSNAENATENAIGNVIGNATENTTVTNTVTDTDITINVYMKDNCEDAQFLGDYIDKIEVIIGDIKHTRTVNHNGEDTSSITKIIRNGSSITSSVTNELLSDATK